MQIHARYNTAARLLLPAMLFGYALVANVDIRHQLAGALSKLPANLDQLSHGLIGTTLETVYKSELPHREFAVELVGAARYILFGEGRRGVVVGKGGWLFSEEEFRGAANADTGIETGVREISKVADSLRSHGIRLIIVPLPAKSDIYRENLADDRYASIAEHRYLDFVHSLSLAKIDAVDTRGALLAAKTSEPVFLKTDTHWTPAGAKAVAGAVAAFSGIAGQSHFALKDEPERTVEGDLVKFVTGERLAPSIGLGHEVVAPQTASRDEAGPLTDILGESDRFPVALVGTSYSANDTWSFSSYLEAALGVDVLNVAEVGRGPVVPMRNFLAANSQLEGQSTVLWEFPVRYLTEPRLWDAPASAVRE